MSKYSSEPKCSRANVKVELGLSNYEKTKFTKMQQELRYIRFC